MPWESANAELYFTDTLWPHFDRTRFLQALNSDAGRDRRHGK